MNILKRFLENTKTYFQGMKNVSIKTYFADWSIKEILWLFISTVAIIIASILTWDSTNLVASWVALLSGVTGMWCVVMVTKGKISNFIFGLANVLLYAYAAYSWKLYGDAMLNAFIFLPMQFIGWYVWTKPKAMLNGDTVKAKVLKNRDRIIWTLASVAGIFGYGLVLKAMGGLTPYLDSMSTVLSIIAVILMTKRFVEQWVLWIVVDVVTVIMWTNIVFNEGGLFSMGILIMWVMWTINAIYGLYNWNKMYKINK